MATRRNSQETAHREGDEIAANLQPSTVDPTANTGVLAADLSASPEILDHNVLPSMQQAASVAAATPDRKRGKSMSRRSGQTGTVVKKGKMWCGRYYEDVPGQDQRRYLCVLLGLSKAMTKAEAKRKLRSILEKRGINAPDYLERLNQDTRTFAQEAEWWRQNRLSLFKPSTQDKMGSHLDKYLLFRFGTLPVSSINERQVQQFIAELSRTEYKTPKGTIKVLGPSTIPNIITVRGKEDLAGLESSSALRFPSTSSGISAPRRWFKSSPLPKARTAPKSCSGEPSSLRWRERV